MINAKPSFAMMNTPFIPEKKSITSVFVFKKKQRPQSKPGKALSVSGEYFPLFMCVHTHLSLCIDVGGCVCVVHLYCIS